jgi:hypothetical protein
MNESLVLLNVWFWAVQVFVVMTAVALVLAANRVVDPRVRLFAWQGAVAVSAALPWIQPWQTFSASPPADVAGSTLHTGWFMANWALFAAGILVAGAGARLLWIVVGLTRLSLLRRKAVLWMPVPPWFERVAQSLSVRATVALSDEVAGPVTFGVLRPSILVPGHFAAAPKCQQLAIVTHELHHVARRDWIWVLGEEVVRAITWFHPAMWWALREVQLAREEVVDRRTIATTGNRRDYLEALVAAVEPGRATPLIAAPSFMRRHQLKVRIRRLLTEVPMSNRKAAGMLAATMGALAMTVWGAGEAFPLRAAPLTAAVVPQDPLPPPPPPPVRATRVQREQLPPPPPSPPPAPPRARRSVLEFRVAPPPPASQAPAPPPASPRVVWRVLATVDGVTVRTGPDAPPPPPPAPPVTRERPVRRMPPPPPPKPPVKKGGE